MANYVVVDIESPNVHANAICSIGLVMIENGKIVDQIYSLVNPEAPFDDICINVHGITANDVSEAPTFPELWSQIELFFTNSVLIAHNATYDLSVISKVLNHYNIAVPEFYYLCTMRLARKYHCYQALSLNSLCNDFQITFRDHHNALADALACADLFQKLSSTYDIVLDEEIQPYVYIPKERNNTVGKAFSSITTSMQEFKGIAKGIILDDIVTDKEIIGFNDWIEENPQLAGHYPFDKLKQACNDILEDGIITKDEQDTMFRLLADFVDPSAVTKNTDAEIIFTDHIFCLTGDFLSGTKEDIAAEIEKRGGICKQSVVKKTDYLIVGALGNENWAYGNYGHKYNKAKELQDKGLGIQIINEDEFIKSL